MNNKIRNEYKLIMRQGVINMKKMIFSILLVAMLAFIAVYQLSGDSDKLNAESISWYKTFGTSEGLEDGVYVEQTSDGGYIAVGTTTGVDLNTMELNPNFKNNIYVVKTDKNGVRLWDRALGDSGSDQGWQVIETSVGDFIVVGNTISGGDYDVYVAKLHSDGRLIWERTYGEDKISEWGIGIVETSDGGFLVVGGKGGGLAWYKSCAPLILKINTYGEQQWLKSQPVSKVWHMHYNSISPTSDGNFMLCGSTTSMTAPVTTLIIHRIYDSGEIIWKRSYTLFGNSFWGFNAKETADGGFIAAGGWNPDVSIYGSASATFLIKATPDGSAQIWRPYEGFFEGFDLRGHCVEALDDGGWVKLTRNNQQTILTRFQSDGTVMWSRYYLLPGTSEPSWVSKTADGGFVITGSVGNWMKAMFIVKTDPSGYVIGLDSDVGIEQATDEFDK